MKKIIFISLVSVLLTGCYTPSSQLNKISIGMSESEVTKVLGQPVSKSQDKNGGETLYYSLQEIFASPPVPYSVTLVNGKVDSYGRDNGSGSRPATPIIIPMAH
jgi:hypothetical protein